MAQAARAARTRTVARRPNLRVVTAPARNRRRGTDAARCRHAFTTACFVMALLTLLGLGRVMLSARAAEISLHAGELRKDIKSERLTGDLLEVDMSALTTPSRIESIAGATMKMTDAKEVSYMRMPTAMPEQDVQVTRSAPEPERVSEVPVGNPSGFASLVSSVMNMAAGEAQLMLVGDVGLASAK